jgi:hypothetical protein
MTHNQLLQEAKDYAERLITAGDKAAFVEVFGRTDPNFDMKELSELELQFIYDNYIADD